MTNHGKESTPEQIAANIKFDRRPDHHEGEVHADYCAECHRCPQCAEKEIALAIRATECEAMYRAAKIVRSMMGHDAAHGGRISRALRTEAVKREARL